VYRVDGDKITWVLNPVQMDYDYYLEYEVTVNSKYSKPKELIKNTADFTYTYINGDILGNLVNDDSVVLGYHNENYSQNAIFKATSDEVVGTDGKFKYVVEFVGQDSKVGDYAIEQIVNDIPTGYLLDGDVSVEYSDGSACNDVTVDTSYSGGFIIEPTNSLKIAKGSGIKVTFTVKPESGVTLPEKRVNHSSIVYNQNDEKNVYSSEVTKTDSQTNEVETAVRWLYLNIEKRIPVEDKLQAFMFKVANGDTTLYTEIYADTQGSETTKDEDGKETNTSYYKGNKVIQITKRGNYNISETDWANTDYDVSKAKFAYTDIAFDTDHESLKQSVDTSKDGEISIYLPRMMYESTAFPLCATDTEGKVYPTVTCTNTLSDYAWLSSQQGVENTLNVVATTTTATSSKAKSSKTPKTADEVATPQAVGTNGLKIENDDEDEEEN
jgi:hypothetical protein